MTCLCIITQSTHHISVFLKKVSAKVLAMKLMALVLVMSYMALSIEDTPKYSCPEIDVDFEGHDLQSEPVPGVVSWEDCGMA